MNDISRLMWKSFIEKTIRDLDSSVVDDVMREFVEYYMGYLDCQDDDEVDRVPEFNDKAWVVGCFVDFTGGWFHAMKLFLKGVLVLPDDDVIEWEKMGNRMRVILEKFKEIEGEGI